MNTLFWIIVAGLIVVAMAVVIYPVLTTATAPIDADHRRRNIAIARQRLADLQQQLQDGALEQAEFDAHYLELQSVLNDDLQQADEAIVSNNSGRWMIPILLVLIPAFSLWLYFELGDSTALRKLELQQTNEINNARAVSAIPLLLQRLKQNPNDLEGWMLLGRTYSLLEQYQSAVDTFAELYRRSPNDVEVMLAYATNLAAANQGSLVGEAEQLVTKALSLSPDNTDALWWAGITKIEQGNFKQALEHWRRLLELLPPDAANYAQVQDMYKALEQQSQASNAAGQVSIKVHVAIDAALKAKFAAETTVFVYAQAVNGPKMPLAIVRKQISELPLEVVLDDSLAMQGSGRLIDQPQLRIVARVSKSGKAISEPGDWQGSVEIKPPFAEQLVTVLINQEVK